MRQLKINKSITPRSEQSLDKYLTEISRVPLVSTEEEVLLAQAIHAGGKKGEMAKDKLVKANLRFVVSVAKQYQNQGVSLTDLISEGNIGLITAADKFDETRVSSLSPMPSGGFVKASFRPLQSTVIWFAGPRARLLSATRSRMPRMNLSKNSNVTRLQRS